MNFTYKNARVLLNNIMLPWLNKFALEELLKLDIKDWRVFEWGSGQSTLWWQDNVKEIVSIEHNYLFYRMIKREIKENCTLYHRKLIHGKVCPYVYGIHKPKGLFDCVVIDGRNRVHCIEQLLTVPKVKDGGFIILDNSERERYEIGINLLNRTFNLYYRSPVDKDIPSAKWETTIWINE